MRGVCIKPEIPINSRQLGSLFVCLPWMLILFSFTMSWNIIYLFSVLEIEPKASHMLGKYYTTELHPKPVYLEMVLAKYPKAVSVFAASLSLPSSWDYTCALLLPRKHFIFYSIINCDHEERSINSPKYLISLELLIFLKVKIHFQNYIYGFIFIF